MIEKDLTSCLEMIYENIDGEYDTWTEDIAKEAIDAIVELQLRVRELEMALDGRDINGKLIPSQPFSQP
jgi:hypothetical protein